MVFKQVLCPTSACLQPPPSKKVKDLTLSDRMHEMLAATMAPAEVAGEMVGVGAGVGGGLGAGWRWCRCWSRQEQCLVRARFTLEVLNGLCSDLNYRQQLTRI